MRESFSCSKPETVAMGDLILIQLPPFLLPTFPPSPSPLIVILRSQAGILALHFSPNIMLVPPMATRLKGTEPGLKTGSCPGETGRMYLQGAPTRSTGCGGLVGGAVWPRGGAVVASWVGLCVRVAGFQQHEVLRLVLMLLGLQIRVSRPSPPPPWRLPRILFYVVRPGPSGLRSLRET